MHWHLQLSWLGSVSPQLPTIKCFSWSHTKYITADYVWFLSKYCEIHRTSLYVSTFSSHASHICRGAIVGMVAMMLRSTVQCLLLLRIALLQCFLLVYILCMCHWFVFINILPINIFQSASASVSGVSKKAGQLIEWVSSEYTIFLHGLARQQRLRKKILHKGSLGVRMMPELWVHS